ncbi:MAG: hypothetical protein QGF31_00815, partial [Nitrospinota bacterium]|nr:hypothetical protein [Nitrospinota bacterium]
MKNKIAILTVFMILSVGTIVFFFQRLQQIMENQIANQVVNSQVSFAETGGNQIKQIFKMAKDELIGAAHGFAMQNLLTANEKKDDKQIELWKSALTSQFLATLEGHRFLSQLRFIDLNGQEIVRVERQKGGSINPVKILQDKSKEVYFSRAMSMESNQIYLSPITLNREFEKIEIPPLEVIRLAMPVKLV